MAEKKLYNEASAYIEYLGSDPGDALWQDFYRTGVDKPPAESSRRSLVSLGSLALYPEFAYARHRLRKEARAKDYDDSPEGLRRLAIVIKLRTEQERYGNLSTVGSTYRRMLDQSKRRQMIREIDSGKLAEPIGLAIDEILHRADADGMRAECSDQVQKSFGH